MDWLGLERTAVLGHSWGGNVATSPAVHFPERVRCLVMIDGGFFDARLRSEVTWETFKARLAPPRNVSGTRREFLERLSTELAECWSDELERIIQTMVYEDEAGQIRDILHSDNHTQVFQTMWDEPASTILRLDCLAANTDRPRRSESRSRRFRVRPDARGDGGGRRPRPQGLPGPLDSRCHPRHRFPQAPRAGQSNRGVPGRGVAARSLTRPTRPGNPLLPQCFQY